MNNYAQNWVRLGSLVSGPIHVPVARVLPFLSARPVNQGLQALGHLADVLDRVADRLRRPDSVQDQSVPQTLR